MEEIFGYIESVVFSSEETGFTVARLKEPRKEELTCIVGAIPSVQPGETIRCKGFWKRHAQHGMQFEVKAFDLESPSDLVGIQKYLESGMIKGIGAVYAGKIVKAFGIETLSIIDKNPERLLDIAGLGPKRVDRIKDCWGQQRQIRDVMIFLRSNGVSPAYAQKIFKTYGEHSIEKVKENPFALAKEIHGIGFKMADAIAKNLGIAPESDVRIDAGIEHVLWELTSDGHVCFPHGELIPVATEILGCPPLMIDKRIEALTKGGQVVKERDFIWLRPLYLCEIGIAREFSRLMNGLSNIRSIDVEKAVDWVQKKLVLELAIEQKQAVMEAVQGKIHIITGGPGTGKSTITKAILSISEKLTPRILLAAPTGRAAKRMSEITGKKAQTIHALLEMDFKGGGFKKNKQNPLECDLIIIDEASMIDTQLMYHLIKAIPSHARVIIIGDIDQLPSVGAGSVLKDLIFSERLKTTKLTQIFRQAAGSRIITNAHLINQGEFPDLRFQKESDFSYISKETPEEILQTIVELVKTRLTRAFRFHRFDDIQVLSPMRRGVIGADNLNFVLQKELNPRPDPLVRMGRSFCMGDKVMQIKNNYQKEVYNGDVGKIIEINHEEDTLKVVFDEKYVSYDFSDIDELVLAYAVSIHKYQGSECPCVIIPVHTSHFKLLYRNLLYTGITRGKKLVVLVGTKRAIMMCIKNEEVKNRHTGLRQAIQQFFPI